MKDAISEKVKILSQQIASELDRITNNAETETSLTDSLVYIGNWQDAIPRSIWADKNLDSIDVRSWGIIRTQAIHQSVVMLSLNKLLKEKLDYSNATVSKVLYILRLTRWISLCSQLRTENGRFRSNIYAIHDAPLSLYDAIYLDEDYLSFVEKQTSHQNKKIRNSAIHIWQSIDEVVKTEFGLHQASPLAEAMNDSLQGLNKQQESNRVHILNTVENNHVYILNMDENDEKHRVYNLNVDEKHHVHILNMDDEKHENEENQPLENNDNHVYILNTAVCSSSSSSSKDLNIKNILKEKTTTTKNSFGIFNTQTEKNQENLIYPTGFNKNEINLAKMYLKKVENDLRQSFLDETAAQIIQRKKTTNPIRNPLGYLSWLCNEHGQGNTYLTSLYLTHQEQRTREERTGKLVEEKQKELIQAAQEKNNQGTIEKKSNSVKNTEKPPISEAEKLQNKKKHWENLAASVRKGG